MKTIKKDSIYFVSNKEALKINKEEAVKIELDRRWSNTLEKLEKGELKENMTKGNWNSFNEEEKTLYKKDKMFGFFGEHIADYCFDYLHINRLTLGHSDLLDNDSNGYEVKSVNAGGKGNNRKYEDSKLEDFLYGWDFYLQTYQGEKQKGNYLIAVLRFNDGFLILKSNKKVRDIIKYAKKQYKSPSGTKFDTAGSRENYIFRYIDMFNSNIDYSCELNENKNKEDKETELNNTTIEENNTDSETNDIESIEENDIKDIDNKNTDSENIVFDKIFKTELIENVFENSENNNLTEAEEKKIKDNKDIFIYENYFYKKLYIHKKFNVCLRYKKVSDIIIEDSKKTLEEELENDNILGLSIFKKDRDGSTQHLDYDKGIDIEDIKFDIKDFWEQLTCIRYKEETTEEKQKKLEESFDKAKELGKEIEGDK